MTSQLYTARQALKLGVVLGAFSTVAAFGQLADANVSEAAALQARMAPYAAKLGGDFSDAALARALGIDVAALRAADVPHDGDLAPSPLLAGLGSASALGATQDAEAGFPAAAPLAARPFALTGAAADRKRALTCLSQAIYYEAGSESDDGGRAVAQVVLNRVRNDLFPHSVCGVVFQGADLATGCQFSFTCNGAMARPAADWAMDRARRIAREALAGGVFAPVGLATHYHADYVSPYWRTSVSRVAQIGAHIFYRWPGELGAPAAFLARYTGVERLVAPHIPALVPPGQALPEPVQPEPGVGTGVATLAVATPAPVRGADGRVHSLLRFSLASAAAKVVPAGVAAEPAGAIPVQVAARPPALITPPVPTPTPAAVATSS